MFLFRRSKTRDVNCSPPEGSRPPEPRNQYGVGENDLPTTKSPGVHSPSNINYKGVSFDELGVPIKEDKKEIKTICTCGCKNVDVMSVVKRQVEVDGKEFNVVDITYICTDCGNMKTETEYLYER